MEYKSILLSKSHLVHPFTLLNEGEELSISDKKVRAVSISIFIGLFTVGVGGVVVFFCLTAKYKRDKLESVASKPPSMKTRLQGQKNIFWASNPLATNFKKSAENQKVTDEIKPSSSFLAEGLEKNAAEKKFINAFVSSFLHPYITGQITRETDPVDRKPLMVLIQENLPGFDPTNKAEIEEMALNAYFEKAAMGLYVNQKWRSRAPDITDTSLEFKILVTALEEALPKDFPEMKFSTQDITDKASKALDAANQQRQMAKEDALNYKRAGDLDKKYEKLRQLRESKQVFLQNR